ncbi:MAG: NAD(+)/NADH kinase [Planctomycetota bacterium]
MKPLVQSIRIELDARKDLSNTKADCLIIVGGDGAILSAAARMGSKQKPSIGIQIGRFGFLSELTPKDCEENLKRIIKGGGSVEERMMLSCRVLKKGRITFKGLALNDAVLASSSSSRMVMLELEIDKGYVTTFHGDGVIVSTPVGSTAHSLSAGGPIMEPLLRAFIITPICSHTLTIRPLVVRSERVLRLRQKGSRNSLTLTLDGQRMHRLGPDEQVLIRTAPQSFQLISMEGRTYFETLRRKFHWGGTLLDDARTGRSPSDGKSV